MKNKKIELIDEAKNIINKLGQIICYDDKGKPICNAGIYIKVYYILTELKNIIRDEEDEK